MASWSDVVGQGGAVSLLQQAASEQLDPIDGISAAAPAHSSMAHAWLITGPPGSGRSNLAYAFAAALLSPQAGDEVTARQVAARTHPDLSVLATSNVIIKIEEVRELVKSSQFSPSLGRYRVVVIEDADRMAERTSNVLLKALEEPPERTVWILCAPSEADLLPTVRSRVRAVRLRVPAVDEVAELIVARDNVDRETAERAARHAQSHIGMAHRLATDAGARERRDETLRLALGIHSVTDAVLAAARMIEIAGADASAFTQQRDQVEREHTLRSLGLEPGQSIPPALRGQIRQLEDDQKRRATRSLRDGIDRILTDLLSLYRDIVMLQLGREESVINRELLGELRKAGERSAAAETMATLDAIQQARLRIEGNVAPALALEAMLVAAIR
ncbi:DNA polymerase III subunit delta' [Okibacterium endophyticum]